MQTNRMLLNIRHLILLLVICWVALTLSACRREEVTAVPPTPVTVIIPTPRSTPLPVVATAIPPGQSGNPLRMVLQPVGEQRDAQDAASDLQTAFLETVGLQVEIELVEREAEALAALCESEPGAVTVAWLNGITYLASQAENCGQPLLLVERGTGRQTTVSDEIVIIVRAEGRISLFAQLANASFCRLNTTDLQTWLFPSLLLRANNIDPIRNLESITDYDTIPDLVAAVAEGDCDAAGLSVASLENLPESAADLAEQITQLPQTAAVPYAVLVVPIEVPLGTRLTLQRTLIDLAEDRSVAIRMRALLGQAGLVEPEPSIFENLSAFAALTGLDFAQLGN
jgi:ABC-type phosphate/phosphonate transport system substrate-binding protein